MEQIPSHSISKIKIKNKNRIVPTKIQDNYNLIREEGLCNHGKQTGSFKYIENVLVLRVVGGSTDVMFIMLQILHILYNDKITHNFQKCLILLLLVFSFCCYGTRTILKVFIYRDKKMPHGIFSQLIDQYLKKFKLSLIAQSKIEAANPSRYEKLRVQHNSRASTGSCRQPRASGTCAEQDERCEPSPPKAGALVVLCILKQDDL